MSIQTHKLMLIRTIAASADIVWSMWTRPDFFSKWYGLANSTLSNVKMDVRVGGGWSALMHIPGTSDISWAADYREVIKPDRLVFAFKNPENLEDPNVELVRINFENLGDKTRMTFSQLGNLPAEEYQTGLKQGWNAYFDRLDQFVAKMKGNPNSN